MKFLLAVLLLITQSFTVFSMQKKEIYLAGGCYWGLEYLLQDLPGVLNTEVGFSGGSLENATYDDVKTGLTGHAETIYISYDEEVISLEQLLFEFFRMHNPTTKNQQGNDIGTQYRSAIFYLNDEQKQIANEVIIKVNKSGHWLDPVVTEITPFHTFYAAQLDHQDYIKKNPSGYSCHFVRDFSFTN
jgi:peptide-methionine (S)-S-oxide reductase